MGGPVWAAVPVGRHLPRTPAASASTTLRGRAGDDRPTTQFPTDLKGRYHVAGQGELPVRGPGPVLPAGSAGIAVGEIDAAQAICQACQVRDRCLRFARETNQEAGISGGPTEAERRRLCRAWLATRRSQSRVNA
ncbi:MAG: WhiB family transcriptional regulator [Actinomycetota bacterium]|nr:WhiB family transcriptional regulator [Actinomycetota bacterium]